MRRFLRLLFAVMIPAVWLGSTASSQLPTPDPKPIIGARMPALSPDGSRLAFVYKGDIWIADSSGGRAVSLTRNVEMDAFPQFSPDGNWISFSSQRNGNWSIYVVPAQGGTVKRLTYHSSGDISYGWSPDGTQLIFCSRRDLDDAILCTLNVSTLRLKKLAQDYMTMNFASFSPDGNTVVYGRNSFFHWTRPRYHGSGAAQIWTLDVRTGNRRQITNNQHQHLWTRFMPDGRHLLTVTVGERTPCVSKLGESIGKFKDSPARTPNLFMLDLNGKGRQITFFTGGSVRFPTIAAHTGDIAFEYEHDLWLLRKGESEPSKLIIYASEDDTQTPVRHETLTSDVTKAEPSPDGKTYAFGLRGDIWSVPIEKPKGVAAKAAEIARRLTDWAGEDSDFCWSPDGKKLYFTSDRQFNTRLYELDLESLEVKPLWNQDEDVSQLHISLDGRKLAFWLTGPEGGLYVLTLKTSKTRRLVHVPGIQVYGHGGEAIAWSPDNQWIAYTRSEPNGAWNIWIVPTVGGDAVNVTRLNAYHSKPTWSPDGKYMFFQSNRDGDALYVLPLTVEPGRTADVDIKFEKPAEFSKVEIDFEDITRRIRKLASQSPNDDLTVTSEGKILFISEGDVWSVSYDGKETKRLTNGGGCSSLRVDKEGKKAFLIRNGQLWTLNIEEPDKLEQVVFKADWERDIRAERKAAFTKLWRWYNRNFYDPNMHGRDWESIRARYEPLLEAVETRDEFATLLGMMVGELEASHSEVGAARGGVPTAVTPHLGFTFDYDYVGPGIRIDQVPTGAPGSFAETRIEPGEYIIAINGKDVTLDENLFRLINNKQGREMEFLVNDKPVREGARTVKYASLSWDEWSNLIYRNRIERLRKRVEEESEGKVGYVHVRGMGSDDQTLFEREFYEYALGKEAMIIDVRYNGGGYISDGLVDWLERKPHGFTCTRDEPPIKMPGLAWDKPLIVLMNESSYSNAEMFPAAMRERKLAKLVGTVTPGYVIAVYDLPLVDGTRARMPFVGIYQMDGTTLENTGVKPDYYVPLTPDDWASGNDPQLDKAIELLIH